MTTQHINQRGGSIRFEVICILGALITYTSMYAFRKPLSAATFEHLSYWGMNYKIIAVISQVIGYTCSKFLGIKIVSGLQPGHRIPCILSFVAVAWVALFLFAVVPAPYNVIFLVMNGLPLGMIFGIVLSFLEGRKKTELLGAGLCISFITASGITKAVGVFLMEHFHVTDFWMPFTTGAVFIPFLLVGVWLLGKIPPPTAGDKKARCERAPMNGRERMKFFKMFTVGVIISTLIYSTLTVYRDLRDNFAVELWAKLGYAHNSAILAWSEIIIAFGVLIIVSQMIRITNNRTAFYSNIYIFLAGGLILCGGTFLFKHGYLSPLFWMIGTGFGLYLCYICFHTMFFERWLALFHYKGTISFLICVADSFGYLGSVGVMLYKNFCSANVDWLSFVTTVAYIAGCLIMAGAIIIFIYFRHKETLWKQIDCNWKADSSQTNSIEK